MIGSDLVFKLCCLCVHVLSHFSRVQLFVILWIVAHQSPLSRRFSRQEYWNGLPCPPPGDIPDPGIEPASSVSPALRTDLGTISSIYLYMTIYYYILYTTVVQPLVYYDYFSFLVRLFILPGVILFIPYKNFWTLVFRSPTLDNGSSLAGYQGQKISPDVGFPLPIGS